jgi:hypothetical protein
LFECQEPRRQNAVIANPMRYRHQIPPCVYPLTGVPLSCANGPVLDRFVRCRVGQTEPSEPTRSASRPRPGNSISSS